MRKFTYHQTLLYTVLGHTTCGSKECMMKGKHANFLKEEKKSIDYDRIKEQMKLDGDTASNY